MYAIIYPARLEANGSSPRLGKMGDERTDECKRLKKLAQEYIPPRVAEFSRVMELYPNGVKITSAKTRHGSCSGKNNLCFSYRLMRYPKEAVDYVIVHELAHIKHKNHQKEFYELIEKYMPDYKERQRLLKNVPKR